MKKIINCVTQLLFCVAGSRIDHYSLPLRMKWNYFCRPYDWYYKIILYIFKIMRGCRKMVIWDGKNIASWVNVNLLIK